MPNPEIIRYITAARAQGIPDETIKAQLISAGWPALDVDQALTPASPPSEVAAPQTFLPGQPTVGSFGAPGPTTPGMMPQSLTSSSQNPQPSKPIKLIISIIVAIIILAGGGFLAYNFLGNKGEEGKETSKATQPKTNGKKESSVVIFDVPALLNKTPAEIKEKIGQPSYDSKGYVSYEKSDWYLNIFFDYDTNAFRYIDVQVPQDPANIKDQKTVFKALNLTEGSDKYIIKLDKSSMNQMIIGVRVYPPGSTDYSLEP